jgi:3-carboxy-cis,cis-muconate cycloisomerase
MEAGHERSAGEWQIEWHALPQTATLTAGCLLVAARVVRGLQARPERMAANLELEQGRIMAEAYMFQLAPTLGREAAHDLVYTAALASKEQSIDLAEALREMADEPDGIIEIEPADYLGEAPVEARRAVAAWRAGSGG